jgi:hypothetical protein
MRNDPIPDARYEVQADALPRLSYSASAPALSFSRSRRQLPHIPFAIGENQGSHPSTNAAVE